MKKCWECGVVIQNGKCLCGMPRPKPSNSQYNSRDEERAAQQSVQLTALRRWLEWLSVGFIVLLVLVFIASGGN
jgi:uncharacterized membrane protein YvbJ